MLTSGFALDVHFPCAKTPLNSLFSNIIYDYRYNILLCFSILAFDPLSQSQQSHHASTSSLTNQRIWFVTVLVELDVFVARENMTNS